MNKLKLAVLVLTGAFACGDAEEETPVDIGGGISAVGVDCMGFDGYTASLGTLTVDCLGTIGPDSYTVSPEGMLKRSFASCPRDATRLKKIDQLLSLQRREARLPHVRECFAGAYADFLRELAKSDVAACPTWEKHETVNPISASVIDAIVPKLDLLKVQLSAPVHVPAELEELNIYHVSFADDAPHGAERAGEIAARCAAGFRGFVLQTAKNSLLTDPVAWLLDTTYPSSDKDPYLRPGYYHPMSWYPGWPQFGDYARATPCPDCKAELCTYYAGGLHKLTKLQVDCLDPDDESTCNSYCGPLMIK